jgi:VWFA-related protein
MRLFRGITCVLAAASLAAPQESVIKVDVDVVSLFCSVRHKKGAFIKDLTKEQFKIYEDGKEQEIRYFTRETDLPLTIGLLIDVSKSQENLIEVEKRAASQFFEKVLRGNDIAFLISFGAEAELLQDFTGSPRLLKKGLEDLRLSVPVGGLHPSPVPGTKMRGTILYDAVYLAATEKLRREVGRKVIVLITDGVDTGSRVKLEKAVEESQKSDVIIYGIYYSDPRYFGGSDSDLKRMAEETGGRVFHVDRKNTLDYAFQQIQEEMRSQYAIGYSPTNAAKDGEFRRIEIKTDNRDHRVAARKGYYPAKTSGN